MSNLNLCASTITLVRYVPSSLIPLSCFALSECWETYNSSKPAQEVCSQCGEALAVVEGKFSGSFVKLGDGIKVHGGCMTAVRISSSVMGRAWGRFET